MTMTAKRTRFIEEYLVDLNPRAAAQRAGYAAAVGYNLLYKPEIAEAVRAAQEERSRRTGLNAERVVRELAAIAFADIRNAVTWKSAAGAEADPADETKAQVRVRDSAAIDEATAAAICEVRRYSWGAVRVKMHDKLGALALLGRHLGMFVDRHEITGRNGGPLETSEMDAHVARLTPEQRTALRAAIRAAVSAPEDLTRLAAAAGAGGPPRQS